MNSEPIGMYVIALVVAVLIFLALREVMCWYYKVNKMLDAQAETNRLLKKLVEQNKSSEEMPIIIKSNDRNYCTQCNRVSLGAKDYKCTRCGSELTTIE